MKRLFTICISAFLILFSVAAKAQVVVDQLLDQSITNISASSLTGLKPSALEVLVSFHGSGAATASQIRILRDAGITRGIAFRSFPIVAALATPLQINLLKTNSSVRSLFLNRDLQYFNENSTALTGVDRVREDEDLTARNGDVPVTGKGVGVLINDSGVDGTHQDISFNSHLVQNVLGTTNLANAFGIGPPTYTENVASTDANSGHGTHCAGIVGGTGAMSGGKYEGVAPGADLIGYGSGLLISILDALGGLDYALQKMDAYSIRVVSNSWGASGGAFNPSDPINIATKALYDNGVVVLFAGGNSGPSSGTMNPYSLAPWVISVAAGDMSRQLADFSSRGVANDQTTFTLDGEVWVVENRPTITAPGVDIVSTRAISPLPVLSTTKDISDLDPSHVAFYTHMSGTSMATPHVAGIAALMLDADQTLTPREVKEILQDTSTPMSGYEKWEAGSGYVNAYNAVSHVLNSRASDAFVATTTNSFTMEEGSSYSITGYPNPVTSTATIEYMIADGGMVKLVIVDSYGNAVTTLLDERQERGRHVLSLRKDLLNLHPGLYVAKIRAGYWTESFRIMIAE